MKQPADKKPSRGIGAFDKDTVARVAQLKNQQGSDAAPPPQSDDYAGSAVNLRKSDWKLLRRVAEARAERKGGRPSVSKVIESLIAANRYDLEAEL